MPDVTNELADKETEFQRQISTVINKFNKEAGSGTPDFILAEYLSNCLESYNKAVKARDKWFSVDMLTEDKKLPKSEL